MVESTERAQSRAFSPLIFGLVLQFVGVLALPSTALGHIGTLSATPEQAGCEDEIVLHVDGSFPDGCWEVLGVSFVEDGAVYHFVISAIDHWQPGVGCQDIVVEYQRTEVVGPLPHGTYTLTAYEEVWSLRTDGDFASLPFWVDCCEPMPQAVHNLRLQKLAPASLLRLTWDDAGFAEFYIVREDTAPDGPFDTVTGTSATGVTGLDIVTPVDTRFYLVAGVNDCGEGPLRD